MSIRRTRKGPLTPEDELRIIELSKELSERLKNYDPSAVTKEMLNNKEYAPPERSYWPNIKAALDAGDDEFDKVVDSLFEGTFEFPPETPEEYEARMKQRRSMCFKY
jgi:hypothetical protein